MTRSDRFFERDSETGWKMREVEAMSKDGCNNRLCIRGGHHCVHRHERGKLWTCLSDTDEREDVERRRESAYILVQVRRHALPRLSKTRVQKERRGWAACLTGWHGVRIQTHPRIEPLGPCKSLKNAAQKVHDPGRIRSAAAHIEHGILGEDVQGHGHVGVQAFGVFW